MKEAEDVKKAQDAEEAEDIWARQEVRMNPHQAGWAEDGGRSPWEGDQLIGQYVHKKGTR